MKTRFIDIDINLIHRKDVLNKCKEYLNGNRVRTIYFLNAHCYNVSQKNKEYKDVINRSNLLLNDGIGVKIGLAMNRLREKENLNGTDLIPEIIELANKTNKNIFLLGGKPGVAEKAAVNLMKKYDECNIVGFNDGYFYDDEKIINDIVSKKTDILIVGMGVPIQELWIDKNKDKLKGVKIAIAGGAILDFMSENIRRAPKIVRKFKLEWVYRLINEPKRLFRRYLIGNFEFLYYMLKGKIVQ